MSPQAGRFARPGGLPRPLSRFTYDAGAGRYRNATTGRFVAARDLPWPSNGGFATSSKETVLPGRLLDRFGSADGRFLGEPGASISARGMAPGTEQMPYNQYRVLKPFATQAGPAAAVPAFNAKGGAKQYLPGMTIQQLLDEGYLEVTR
ncbi:MAG: TNT domain-containing protein [Planctomycetia bacterium]